MTIGTGGIIMDTCRVISSSSHGMMSILLLVILMTGCASTNRELKEHPFKVDASMVVKDVYKIGDQLTPGLPASTYSPNDPEVISYIRLNNVTGSHYLRWEWYDPWGRLYESSNSYPIHVSEGNFIEDLRAVHKISVKGEKAQKIPGKWTVYVYYDNDRIAGNSFEIEAPAVASAPSVPIAPVLAVPVPLITDEFPLIADIDTDIPQTSMYNPDAVAVVIGNRKYKNKDIPEVKYAQNDARTMKEYLVKVLGYGESNVILKLDATKADFEQFFGIRGNHEGEIFDRIKPGRSDVFVYYSGHGAPDINVKNPRPYFVPSDCSSSKYHLNGYPVDLLYENLAKLEAKSTTVVLDACFSGSTNTGKQLIEGSVFGIKVDNPAIAKANAICITSSEGDQISSWYDEKHHGLFTYFFLKGLRGEADKNRNRVLTYEELYEYVSDRADGVPYWAKILHHGRKQTPTMQGVLVSKPLVKY